MTLAHLDTSAFGQLALDIWTLAALKMNSQRRGHLDIWTFVHLDIRSIRRSEPLFATSLISESNFMFRTAFCLFARSFLTARAFLAPAAVPIALIFPSENSKSRTARVRCSVCYISTIESISTNACSIISCSYSKSNCPRSVWGYSKLIPVNNPNA